MVKVIGVSGTEAQHQIVGLYKMNGKLFPRLATDFCFIYFVYLEHF